VKARLDAIDWQILKELQEDGRMTNVELARRVGISAPPCLSRVRALEEAGLILGYRTLLDEKQLGYDVTAFAMVGLHSQTEADLIAFEQTVANWPLVRESYMLSGEVDFLSEMRLAGFADIPEFHDPRTHGCAKRGQCAHSADDSPDQGRAGRADRRLIFASQVFLNV
jgi:DNA-binding Lrp family transcriptional regulator